MILHSDEGFFLRSLLPFIIIFLLGSVSLKCQAQGNTSLKTGGKVIKEQELAKRAPTFTISLSGSANQPITGWGCFPGFIDWGAGIGICLRLPAQVKQLFF